MIVTLIKNTNGTREMQYGRQYIAVTHGVDSYTYIDITETEVQKIREAKTEEIQKLLAELY